MAKQSPKVVQTAVKGAIQVRSQGGYSVSLGVEKVKKSPNLPKGGYSLIARKVSTEQEKGPYMTIELSQADALRLIQTLAGSMIAE